MKLLIVATLLLAAQADNPPDLPELRSRATTIMRQRSTGEITDEQARRRIQLLLKAFEAWLEANDADPELRNRTYATDAVNPTAPLTVNRCPLVFDEDSSELCPLDLKRSELWGGTILFCRYLCE